MTDISGKDMVYNTESVHHENGILVTNGLVHQEALGASSFSTGLFGLSGTNSPNIRK